MHIQTLPESHPLDFDWRFEPDSINELASVIGSRPILAVGTPQLARAMISRGNAVQLVDRQPHLAPLNAILLDIETAGPLAGSWMTAILDPPWYPSAYLRWIGWAAQHVPVGGTIFASLWPADTRPMAQIERDAFLAWASNWAECRIEPALLNYEVPTFECVVRQMEGIQDPSAAWRKGDLLELQVRKIPVLPPPITKTEVWHRFVWDDYQLALRIRSDVSCEPSIAKHPLSRGWIWPSYSRRASGRALIDLWSSRNEVALVSSSLIFKEELSRFTEEQFAPIGGSRAFRELFEEWQVPSPPFQRSYSWVQNA